LDLAVIDHRLAGHVHNMVDILPVILGDVGSLWEKGPRHTPQDVFIKVRFATGLAAYPDRFKVLSGFS
jgi:hypothetical protein